MPASLSTALQNFYPYLVGDSIGCLEGRYFFPLSACWLWCVSVLAITLPLFLLLLRGFPRGTGHHLGRIVYLVSVLLVPPTFAVLLCLCAHVYWGGPFNHEEYHIPQHSGDLVMWFTGADDGAFTARYWEGTVHRSDYQFGHHRSALFSFADVDQALLYASRLPTGTRLIVRGHSMGASAAMMFAEHSPRDILLLDTRDPTSWFHRRHAKPACVTFWRHVLPAVTELCPPRSEHVTTNYWGSLNMANLFRLLGRAWPEQPEAITLIIPGRDHHSVGNNLPQDPCILPME